MIITIGGTAGSGKSTIARMLAEKLGWSYYYIGDLRREKAREKGMTLAEYNKLGENDPSTDIEVDEFQKKIAKKENNFIMEGRTSWHFIPHSIKIYVDVDEKEGARRVWKELRNNHDKRNENNKLKTLAEVLKNNRQRKKSDMKRYKKYYNINVYDSSHYDFIINTTNINKKEGFNKVYKHIRKRLKMVDKNENLL